MERYVTNEGDIVLKHRMGCQIVFFILGITMIVIAGIVIFKAKNVKTTTYIYSALLAVLGVVALYVQSRRLIKERINNIPAMVITDKSLIVSRKKDEYNEIPFDVIEDFHIYRRIHGSGRNKSSTTYLKIIYKEPDENSISALVDNIIKKQTEDGQFQNVDLTMRDFSTIKKVLKKKLMSIYHVRIAYPDK